LHRDDLINPQPPKDWRELQKHPYKQLFIEAMDLEIKNLVGRGTWELVDCASAKTKPIPLKWVFTYKFDQEGYLLRAKARICVRGNLQPESIFESMCSSTLAAKSFRVAMAIAARFDLEIWRYNFINAFLNAILGENGEEVYC
jgi:hypothetical protein